MSEQRAKKLSLALYLNPVVSDADQVAMSALQQWYEKTRQSYGDQPGDELDSLVRVFHHDVYLAGLHLYLINPRLCRLVAEALAQDEHSIEALEQQLIACGLRATGAGTGGDSAFSATQMEQLERLLASLSAPPAESVTETGQTVPQTAAADSGLVAQLAEQQEQLMVMTTELQKLRTLAEEQAQLLQQLRLGEQSTTSLSEPAPSSSTEEISVAGMAPQIAQMQKIRKKGVF